MENQTQPTKLANSLSRFWDIESAGITLTLTLTSDPNPNPNPNL